MAWRSVSVSVFPTGYPSSKRPQLPTTLLSRRVRLRGTSCPDRNVPARFVTEMETLAGRVPHVGRDTDTPMEVADDRA